MTELTLPVRLRLPRPAGAGWVLGVQVCDPESGRFLEEGRWQELPESGEIDTGLSLPAEPGGYRLHVCPVHETEGWAYARGAKFWALDVLVDDTGAHLVRRRLTTMGALRRRQWAQGLRAALTEYVTCAWRNRDLIGSMAQRDIAARYRGSFAELFWSWLNPLLLMAAYVFVFGFVLRTRFGADQTPVGFTLYFLGGMIPWLGFSEALARSPNLLPEYRLFVKRIVYPVETLPVTITLAGASTSAIAGIIYLIALNWMGRLTLTALWLPALIVPQILLTLGLSWLLAGIGAFVRDVVQVIGFVLTLWFFLTPICYPETSLPDWAWTVLRFNPMLHIARAWRAVLLEGQAPETGALVKLWLIGIFGSVAGFLIFYRLKKSIPDVL